MKLSARLSLLLLSCVLLLYPALGFCSSATQPAPLINPLKDLKLYSKVEYREAYPINLKIPEEGKKYETVKVYGDKWDLEAPYQKSRKETYEYLVSYINSLGGEIFHQDKPTLLLARLRDEGGQTWWVDLAFQSKGYHLAVSLVRTFTLQQPVNIEFSKNAKTKVNFYHDTKGERFETLVLNAPPGEFWLNISSQEKIDGYSRDTEYKRVFKQESPQQYRLTDIPQDAGQYLWEISARNSSGGVALQIEESGALPAIQRSDELGSLLIKNIANSYVYAEPDGPVKIRHPEVPSIPVRGDLVPDGGSLLMLPPGFWKLSISPPDNKAVKRVEAHMIPVRPGKQTVVDWPAYVTRAFGTVDSLGGVEITDTQVDASEGTIQFNLVGEEAKSLNLLQARIDVTEGAEKGRILGVEELKVPPDIVLLLDSSGSMKGQMQTALEATRTFIKGLPENARIRIIDFDTEPKAMPGETKKAALASLDKVRADGATALYDTVLEGLKLLKESGRPSLVVFTDGVDANWNDSGPGSKATQKELLEAVGPAKVPIFSIGFGKKHDRDTLNRLASVSGGLYFSADNAKTLSQTFATVLESVVNSYQLRYARPEHARASDVPFIQLVLDTSGSMGDSIISNKGVSRLDSLKEILGDFLLALPDETLVSIQSFSDDSLIRQVATSDKSILLRSIGMLQPEGGTKIVTATDAALRSLRAIPSSQRYLVFVTDEAISLSVEEQEIFDTLLGKIHDEGIKSLWIGTGLGRDSSKSIEAFKHASDLSGGRFVVEDDPDKIESQFSELSTAIQQVAPGSKAKTNLRLLISQRDANGKVHAFAASALAGLPSRISKDEVVAPKLLTYGFQPMPPRYDAEASVLLTGDSTPREAAVITKRIPLNVQAANKACTFSVSEALYLSRLRSVDAPNKQRFLALTMEFNNILPEQDVVVYPDGSDHPATWLGGGAKAKGRVEKKIPSYLIPDLQRHLYLQLNNSLMLPVSTVTWLAEAPMILPGEQSVKVRPGTPVRGTVIFLAPELPVDQASLHFYDTRYGHVDLALVGEFAKALDIEELPPGAPMKLSDAFSLALQGYDDQAQIEEVKAPSGTLFRIIELNLQSNVQALLDVDPFARFSLRLPTSQGSVQFPLHGTTSLLPLGFWRPTMFAPGSDNHVRLAFQIPADLAKKNPGELVVDVKGGGVVLPLGKDGSLRPKLNGKVNKGDGIDLIVNATGSLKEVNGQKGDWRVIDLTLIDKPDGEATRVGGVFALHRDDAAGREWRFASPDEVEKRKKGLGKFSTGNKPVVELQVKANPANGTLLTGLTGQSVVPDGGERRGVIVFRMPDQDDSGHSWQLRSGWFPDLAVSISEKPYKDKSMLRERFAMDGKPSDDEKKLMEALLSTVREYRARTQEKPGRHEPAKISLDATEPSGREMPVPSLVIAGAEKFRTIVDIDGLKKALEKLPWLPGANKPWETTISPEALFTQGWGTDDDLARAAEVVLTRMGYETERKIVKVTEQGGKALAQNAGISQLKRKELPAIGYLDHEKKSHLLVAPFLKDVTELENLVTVDSNSKPGGDNAVELRVEAEVMPVSGERTQMTGKMAAALAGGDGKQKTRTITLLKIELDREQLSRDPADLVYVEGFDAQGGYYTAVLDGPGGQVAGEGKVYKRTEIVVALKIWLRFRSPVASFEHVRPLAEGEELTGLFQTLGLNLPDLPQQSAAVLEAALGEASKKGDPDDLSALRWYTHSIMARFLAGQTKMEKDLAGRLKIMTGRTTKPRVIVMNVSRNGGDEPTIATIDLIQAGNEIYSGSAEAARAFHIAAGLGNAKLEESVLGRSGYGVLRMWENAPEETKHFWITNSNRRDITKILSELNYPQAIVNHIKSSRQFILFPTNPTVINGLPRWGWLEIDPQSYEIVSVLDNGLHGGIVEYDLNTWYSEAQLHMFGFLLGVSSSVWSVSSFSLIIGDYEEIMKQAEAMVRGIAKNLETFRQNLGSPGIGTAEFIQRGGAPSEESGGGDLPVSFGGGPGAMDMMEKKEIMEYLEDSKIQVGQDFMGFAQGFEMGVNYYFGH